MKSLFTLSRPDAVVKALSESSLEFITQIPEDMPVLLTGQPFSDRVCVFVPVGCLDKSTDLANEIGQFVHGRRWGTVSRNDGHYIEIAIETFSDDKEPANATGK